MLKHYIECRYPGLLIADQSTEEIKKRKRPVRLPKGCFGYRFFDRAVIAKDGEKLRGRPKNFSPWTYIGRQLTLAQVKKETPHETILIGNMESSGYVSIVQTLFGQAFPLEKGDKVEK